MRRNQKILNLAMLKKSTKQGQKIDIHATKVFWDIYLFFNFMQVTSQRKDGYKMLQIALVVSVMITIVFIILTSVFLALYVTKGEGIF